MAILHTIKSMKKNEGFTLVETLVAILILSMSIGALLTLAAGGFYSVRYARNEIVAINLMQEATEYIRNTRDTTLLSGGDWNTWITSLNVDENGAPTTSQNTGCFSRWGCVVDIYTISPKIRACPRGGCPSLAFYPNQGLYAYTYNYLFAGGPVYTTSYVRTVTIVPSSYDSNQVIVTVTIKWLNGNSPKTVSQSEVIANWST